MSQKPDDTAEIYKLLDDTLARLAEHFEAIQIMVTRYTEDGTQHVSRGTGNWYARQGMAHEFIGLARADEVAERITTAQDSE